jgi:hypothetical protein
VHRYAKRGLADIKTPAHIECFCIPQKGSQAELVRDRDGKTTLRQEEPGLPAKIGVNYAEMQANAGAPMRATLKGCQWGTKPSFREYEKCNSRAPKHHSRVGHDSRPAPHYKQVVTALIVNSSSCSFPG